MNEEELIQQAAAEQNALRDGKLAPSRVQKVVRGKNGEISLRDIPAKTVAAATQLREARSRSGMTQKDFAELLGVPLSSYRKYEQYLVRPPQPVLKLSAIAARSPELIPSLG
ncbi:MAG: helix-turn-helix domain-containing protein [Verrucomicrobiales bacterium]